MTLSIAAQSYALRAFRVLKLRGYARIDFILAKERLYDTEGQLRMVDTLARLRPAHLLLFGSARRPRTSDDFVTPLGGIVDIVRSDPVFITQLRPDVPAELLRIDWSMAQTMLLRIRKALL